MDSLEIYAHLDCHLILYFQNSAKGVSYDVHETDLLERGGVGFERSELPDYCIDYFWEAKLNPEDSPEKGVIKYTISFDRFFELYLYNTEFCLDDGSFKVYCKFRKHEEYVDSPRLTERFTAWLKNVACKPLYVAPFEGKLTKKHFIDNYLSPIINNSSLEFEDFYSLKKVGLFDIFFPNKEKMDEAKNFADFRKSVSRLGIKINVPSKKSPWEAIEKLANLFGVEFDVDHKPDSNQNDTFEGNPSSGEVPEAE